MKPNQLYGHSNALNKLYNIRKPHFSCVFCHVYHQARQKHLLRNHDNLTQSIENNGFHGSASSLSGVSSIAQLLPSSRIRAMVLNGERMNAVEIVAIGKSQISGMEKLVELESELVRP